MNPPKFENLATDSPSNLLKLLLPLKKTSSLQNNSTTAKLDSNLFPAYLVFDNLISLDEISKLPPISTLNFNLDKNATENNDSNSTTKKASFSQSETEQIYNMFDDEIISKINNLSEIKENNLRLMIVREEEIEIMKIGRAHV